MSSAAELPEPDGDWEWQKIVNDPRPRPALTALGDEIESSSKPFRRLAVTSKPGPSLYHLLEVLGKKKSLVRSSGRSQVF